MVRFARNAFCPDRLTPPLRSHAHTALLCGGTSALQWQFWSVTAAVAWAVVIVARAGSNFPPEAIQLGQRLAATMDFASLVNETCGHGGPWEGTVPALPQVWQCGLEE